MTFTVTVGDADYTVLPPDRWRSSPADAYDSGRAFEFARIVLGAAEAARFFASRPALVDFGILAGQVETVTGVSVSIVTASPSRADRRARRKAARRRR